MTERAFVICNYVVLGLALLYFTLLSVRDTYASKRSLAIGMAFYTVKFYIDGTIYPILPYMTEMQRLAGFAWGLFTICMCFPLCALMFWGDLAGLYCNMTAVNTILSITQLTSFYLANLIMGKPFGTPFQESYGLGTVLALVIFTLEFFCLRKPLAWMEGGIQRFPHRFQVLLAELTFLATTGFVYSFYQPAAGAVASSSATTYWKVVIFAIVPFLVIALLQLILSRRERTRESYIRSVEELMRSYKKRIAAQLAIAGRDRQLFDDLEEELERLGEQSGSAELLERIRKLELDYERIKEGTYCENPVYDAFLCAQASRLEALGVCPRFSVAVLAPTAGVRPRLILVLLSEVDRLAAHAKEAAGSEVNLRIRSLNDMMHVSLDIPSSWGHLRARQLLNDAGFHNEVIVRESVTNGRTEVLVMSQKEGPCLSS